MRRMTVLHVESMFYSGSPDVLYSQHHFSILLWHMPSFSARLLASPGVPGILHLQCTIPLVDLCELVGGALLLELSVESIALADSWDVVPVPSKMIRQTIPPTRAV